MLWLAAAPSIERLLVAPHFRLAGSGLVWPDLGANRISAITASQGFPPETQDSADADIFRITLDPGSTVTYVAELRTPNLPQLTLWAPDAYKDQITNLTLYKGIVIGIAGLLALFLTIVFVVRGAVIFPAAAALAWAVLAYVCIDFGFWHRLVPVGGDADQVARAGYYPRPARRDGQEDAVGHGRAEQREEPPRQVWPSPLAAAGVLVKAPEGVPVALGDRRAGQQVDLDPIDQRPVALLAYRLALPRRQAGEEVGEGGVAGVDPVELLVDPHQPPRRLEVLDLLGRDEGGMGRRQLVLHRHRLGRADQRRG